jgi:hypothetical protein
MRNISERTVLFCLVLFTGFIFACAYDKASLRVDKSLPPEKLERYNDSFDKNDLWEKAGYINNATLRTNFRQADVSIEGGRLTVETKSGFFSSGGLFSKFYLRGDFDIQVDCMVEFLENVDDIDRIVVFNASDVTSELEEDKLVNTSLSLNKWAKKPVFIIGGFREKGKSNRLYLKQFGNFFNGTLRIVRTGKKVTLIYKTIKDIGWQEACSISGHNNDIRITFRINNYRVAVNPLSEGKSIFSAQFYNFRINAAQDIIEAEI